MAIKELGSKAGVAINPATPIEDLREILPYIDLVNVMTVEPGFGGQRFITGSPDKIRRLRTLAPDLDIEVDGGVTAETAPRIVRAGANVLVAGSAVFKGGSGAYRTNIAAIRNAAALARGEAA